MIFSLFEPVLLSMPLYLIGAWVYLRLLNPRRVNILRITMLTFVAQFGLIPLVSFFIQSTTTGIKSSFSELQQAYFILAIFLGGILVVQLFADSLNISSGRKPLAESLFAFGKNNLSKKLFWSWIACMGILLYIKFAYGFTYYGSSTLERNLSLPYHLVILKSMMGILINGYIVYGLVRIIRFRDYNPILFAFVLSDIILKLDSRTNYVIVLFLWILILAVFCKFRPSLKRLLPIASITVILFVVFFPILQEFRAITHQQAEADLSEVDYTQALAEARSADPEKVNRSFIQNLEYRTNFIDRNVTLQNFAAEGGFMNGLNFIRQAAYVIPRFLFPEKVNYVNQLSNESAVFFFYQKRKFDFADNIPIYGYLDFGYTGVFLSGILFAFLMLFMEGMALFMLKYAPLLSFAMQFFLISTFVTHEISYTGLLAVFRDITIFFIIMTALFWSWKIVMKTAVNTERT